jgi:hypothetical protein
MEEANANSTVVTSNMQCDTAERIIIGLFAFPEVHMQFALNV